MIQVRPITEDDQQAFYDLVNNNRDKLIDFFPITIEKAATIDKALEAIRFYNSLAAIDELHVLMMTLNDEVIGMVFIKNIDHRTDKCELAYFTDKNFTGKGYTTEAVNQAIDMAFNKLGMNKVYGRIATYNEASNRLAAKAGFQLEGVLRQEYRIHDGSLIDLNYYGKIRD